MPQCHTPVLTLLIISVTRACGLRYETRCAAALHNDCTIPFLRLPLCGSASHFFTSKTHCLNENFPFWVGSSLKALNLAFYPLPVRLYWDRNSHAVALTLVLISVYLHQSTFFPFYPS